MQQGWPSGSDKGALCGDVESRRILPILGTHRAGRHLDKVRKSDTQTTELLTKLPLSEHICRNLSQKM